MINDILFPEELSGPELDYYLSLGWFRMGQSIFTTDYAGIGGMYHPVYWLRIALDEVQFGRRQRRLLAANAHFDVTWSPLTITGEADDLYQRYSSWVKFDTSESISGFLYFGADYNIYNTQMLEVRDQGRLVALGIFDQGQNSIAGIMNIFDPEYRSKSLGKFLMLQKIMLARKEGFAWYYPGYLSPQMPKFDYKLYPAPEATSWYSREEAAWIDINRQPPPPANSFPIPEPGNDFQPGD